MSAGPATVTDWLAHARGLGLERLDAQLLLAHHLGQGRAWVIAHPEAEVAPETAERLASDLRQRARGVPLAQLTGEREFHGLRLRITPDVLDPRPDTETLVDWALELLLGAAGHRQVSPQDPVAQEAGGGDLQTLSAPRVLDLGTGSGAIALAIKAACPRAQLTAVDRSASALSVARDNGERLGLHVHWLLGDWFSAVADQRFDLVVANPPYIDAGDPHLDHLSAEPLLALSPGADGMAALSHLAATAPGHLQPGGHLLLEHGHAQGEAVRRCLIAAGFVQVRTRTDLAGRERCTGGRAGPPSVSNRPHGAEAKTFGLS